MPMRKEMGARHEMSLKKEDFMDKMQNLKTVAQFSRLGNAAAGETHITQIQDGKSAYAQPIGNSDGSIIMAEYQVDSQTNSAGFSTRSQTVDVSSR